MIITKIKKTEDKIENYFNKSILNVDCGEIYMAQDTCRLMSLNLYSYVVNPFTKNSTFNIDLFEQHVKYGQRIMDDMVDLEIDKINNILSKIEIDPEPIEIKRTEIELWNKIKQTTLNSRRTGLGYTGLGDTLAAMNLQYSSEESIEFIKNTIMNSFAKASLESDIDLAEERGSFVGFDYNIESKNDFIQLMLPKLNKSYIDKYKKFGRRNVAQTALAPTGSISLLTKTTSGIEPTFMIYYTRRKKVNPNDKNSKVAFTDKQGDSFEEYNVVHSKFIIWYSIYKNITEQESSLELSKLDKTEFDKLITVSPYYKSTASEINWINRCKIQGIIQQYIQQSISSTCNLPNNVTEQEISTIYLEAWKQGCKGFTIYREGSRDGILIDNSKNATNINNDWETHAPKRPKILPAEIIRFTSNSEKWISVIGLLNNKPYELFTGKSESFNIPQKIEKGFIIRNKENGISRYDFQYVDSDGFKCTHEGLNRTFDKQYYNYARLLSGVLRQGMPLVCVYELIGNLKFEEDGINTWKTGVERTIKKFIKDGIKSKNKCPDCGELMVFSESCQKCPACGMSKCG
jgi:ribonucleoside-diphosphate reductase alpha chain